MIICHNTECYLLNMNIKLICSNEPVTWWRKLACNFLTFILTREININTYKKALYYIVDYKL
jgi:hypothetical protein